MFIDEIKKYFCLHKKFLVYNLVSRDLKLRYKRSFFGVLWTLLIPLATAGMYYFAFKLVLKIQIENYPVFVLCGVLPWSFFSFCIIEPMNNLEGHISLLSKAPIPFQVLPLVICVGGLVNFIISLFVIVFMALLTDLPMGINHFLLIPLLIPQFILAYSIGIITSVSFVFLRDLKHIIALAMPMMMYATPILYREDMVPESMRWILNFNPFASYFVILRKIILEGEPGGFMNWILFIGWTISFLTISFMVWKWKGKGVVESL